MNAVLVTYESQMQELYCMQKLHMGKCQGNKASDFKILKTSFSRQFSEANYRL